MRGLGRRLSISRELCFLRFREEPKRQGCLLKVKRGVGSQGGNSKKHGSEEKGDMDTKCKGAGGQNVFEKRFG